MQSTQTAQLDETTSALLANTDGFFIQQRVRWGEALTQGCFEQKNIYDVFDKTTNNKIMVIMEESQDLNRCCCAPTHSFFAKFFAVNEATGEPVGVPVMTMEREGCDCFKPCPKPLLCCFACKDGCADRSALYAGDLGETAIPGELKGMRDKSNLLGETIQPLNGGKFKPVLQIMDRGDGAYTGTAVPDTHMFAALRGPCFFGGCSEFCCDSAFGISKAKDGMGIDEIHQLTFDHASITKLKPKNFTQALREAFTDSDLYDVTFKEPSMVTPQQKANILAAMVLTEYMFFERDNDMCYYDGQAFHLVFCNCFIYGCVCPCQLVINPNQGGGGGGGGGG